MNTIELTTVIDFWKNYEPSTVLLAYAELKRRKYELNEILSYRITEFCANNNYDNIDSFLSAGLKTIGYDTYDQYYHKEIYTAKHDAVELATGEQAVSTDRHDVEKKYPALRIISNLYKIFAYLTIILTLFIAFGVYRSIPTLFLTSIFTGVFFVLGLFAAAESIMVIIDIERNTRTNNKR